MGILLALNTVPLALAENSGLSSWQVWPAGRSQKNSQIVLEEGRILRRFLFLLHIGC